MATVSVPNSSPRLISTQGILEVGANTFFIVPQGGIAQIKFGFYNAVAYDITMSVTQKIDGSPVTVDYYSISLEAGDKVEDSGYSFFHGETITITNSVAGTSYYLSGQVSPKPTGI